MSVRDGSRRLRYLGEGVESCWDCEIVVSVVGEVREGRRRNTESKVS